MRRLFSALPLTAHDYLAALHRGRLRLGGLSARTIRRLKAGNRLLWSLVHSYIDALLRALVSFRHALLSLTTRDYRPALHRGKQRLTNLSARTIWWLQAGNRLLWPNVRSYIDALLKALISFRHALLLSVVACLVLSWPQQIQELYADVLGRGLDSWIQLVFALCFLAAFSASTMFLLELNRSRYFERVDHRSGRIVYWAIFVVTTLAPILMLQLGVDRGVFGVMASDFDALQELHARLTTQIPQTDGFKVFPTELSTDTRFSVAKLRFMNWTTTILIVLLLTPYPARLMRSYLERHGVNLTKDGPTFAKTRVYQAVLAITVVGTLVFALPYLIPLFRTFFAIPQFLGSLAIIISFLTLAALHFAALSDLGERTGYPVVGGLFGLALVFSFWHLNDNHEVPTLLVEPLKWETTYQSFDEVPFEKKLRNVVMQKGWSALLGGDSRLPYLEEAFSDWLRQRPANVKARFAGQRYPVLIVAAEGGGIFAAAQTALFLARLYDRCPLLAHHLFAISSVSGGSLGASLVSSLVKRRVERPSELGHAGDHFDETCSLNDPFEGQKGPLEEKATRMLSDDHLAPVVAAGLYPDFLQRFLPYPIASLDRARALDKSIESSWENAIPGSANYFSLAFRDHWTASGQAPMLMLNTTSVELGEQIVIAPFEAPGLPGREVSFVRSFFGKDGFLSKRYDVSLSSAVGLSARFPGISPPGYLVERDKGPEGDTQEFKRSGRLVDGGYIDNSGVETALLAVNSLHDLFVRKDNRRLAGFEAKPVQMPDVDIELYVVVIGGVGSIEQEENIRFNSLLGGFDRSGLNELGTPVSTLLNTRKTRAASAVQASYSSGLTLGQTTLPWSYINPPLGWKMTPRTVSLIGALIGSPERCLGGQLKMDQVAQIARKELQGRASDQRYSTFVELVTQNHCTACRIVHLISGLSPDGHKSCPAVAFNVPVP